jgi:hypothetical protein
VYQQDSYKGILTRSGVGCGGGSDVIILSNAIQKNNKENSPKKAPHTA